MSKAVFSLGFRVRPAFYAATLLLAACGEYGTTTPNVQAAATVHNLRIAEHSALASSKDLIYVSTQRGTVYVYNYPSGRLFQELTGFDYPQGLCTDPSADVFVTSRYTERSASETTLFEFRHGEAQPIAQLNDPLLAGACSVDPNSGDLAACGPEGVAVFRNGTGAPTLYYATSYVFVDCSYDDRDNLYVLSRSNSNGSHALLFRLSAGSESFTQIQLSVTLEGNDNFPTVQWDGRYLAVSSQGPDGTPLTVYRLRVHKDAATVVSSASLNTQGNVFGPQLWISGNAIFGTGHAKRTKAQVFSWSYKKGGDARVVVDRIGAKGYAEPWGITLSKGSHGGS